MAYIDDLKKRIDTYLQAMTQAGKKPSEIYLYTTDISKLKKLLKDELKKNKALTQFQGFAMDASRYQGLKISVVSKP